MLRRRLWLVVPALVLLAASFLVHVPADHFAVRESYGGAVTALDAGLRLRVPLLQRLYRYDTTPVAFDAAIEIVTKDNATFKLPVKVTAHASRGDALTFHQESSGRDARTYIQERIREAVLAGAARLTADQLLDPAVARQFGPAVSADLLTHGIADDGVTLGEVSPVVVFNAVTDYLNRRFPASARRLAELSLARDPHEALFHAAMGMVLETEKKTLQAEEEYLSALYINPGALQPMSRLFVIYLASGDAAKIGRLQRILEASIEKDRTSAVHHDWLGQAYLRRGRLDKADLAFTTAVGLAPQNPEFRISLGGLRVRQGRYDDAIQAFEEALRLRPDYPLALYDLGTTHAIQGRYDEAIEAFQRAERSGPPTPALFNATAQAFEEKGDLTMAAEYLKRSLALRPEQSDRRAALKRVEAKLRN